MGGICGYVKPTSAINRNVSNQRWKNEKKVRLDYLVVEKVVSLMKLKFDSDVRQELVSKTFANALYSSYSNEKFSLWISPFPFFGSYIGLYDALQFNIRGSSKLWKKEITVENECFRQIVESIFARFPIINLKLHVLDLDMKPIEHIALVVSEALDTTHNVTIDSLEIHADYSVILRSQGLIEKLSENLKVLKLLVFKMNNMNGGDRSASKEFWKTVSSCLKMTTLIVSLKYDLLKDFEPLSHLTKCLKPIKVKRLGFNLCGPPGIIGMVLGTIVENENLRQLKLMCHDAHFNLSHFGSLMNDENISLALSRLDSLKLTTTYCDFDLTYNWEVSLTKIIRALNDHALLKIFVHFDCDRRMLGKHILAMLQFYVKLSQQTAKAIQLRFVLCHGFVEKKDAKTIAIFNRALGRLSSMNIRPGLQMICVGSWTRILFENANLMRAIFSLRAILGRLRRDRPTMPVSHQVATATYIYNHRPSRFLPENKSPNDIEIEEGDFGKVGQYRLNFGILSNYTSDTPSEKL